MANFISFNAESIRLAMTNLLRAIETNDEGALADMPDNVKKFHVNGDAETTGGIIPLTVLVGRLKSALHSRSGEAMKVYQEMVSALDKLELIISDLNKREDENSRISANTLEQLQSLMQSELGGSSSSAQTLTGGGGGGGGGNTTQPTREDIIKAGQGEMQV